MYQPSDAQSSKIVTKTPKARKLKNDYSPEANRNQIHLNSNANDIQVDILQRNQNNLSSIDPQTEYRNYAEMHNTDRGTSVPPQTGVNSSVPQSEDNID